MASRPDDPTPSGLGPEESDTPPADLPDMPNVSGDADLPEERGPLDPDDDE